MLKAIIAFLALTAIAFANLQYRIDINAQDQDGHEIICIDIDTVLRRP